MNASLLPSPQLLFVQLTVKHESSCYPFTHIFQFCICLGNSVFQLEWDMAQEQNILLGVTEGQNWKAEQVESSSQRKKIAWGNFLGVSPPLFSIHKTAHEFSKLGLRGLSGEERQACRVHELWECNCSDSKCTTLRLLCFDIKEEKGQGGKKRGS